MTNKLKWTLGILVIIVVVLSIFLVKTVVNGNVIKENDKPTVKIGVIVPLSGDLAFLGNGYQNAIGLAQSETKDTKYNYEVIYEDSKNLDAKETLSAAQKLINVDQVDVILTISSGTGNIVSPVTEENKIVHIGYASDPNVAKGTYNFVHATTPQRENEVMIKALQARGIKKVAIMHIIQDGAVAIMEDLKQKLKSTDIEVVSYQKFPMGTKDFKTVLEKAKASNPDIYIIQLFSPDLEIFAKQAKELDVSPLTSIEAFDITEQPELFEGRWYVAQPIGSEKYRSDYVSKYGGDVPPMGSPNSYDMFKIIVSEYEKEGKKLKANEKPSHIQIANDIANLQGYSGALGELTVLSNHIIDSNAIVREIQNGKRVVLGE